MGLGDILDETFDLYKNNFALLAGIGALVFFPLNFLAGLANNFANTLGNMQHGGNPSPGATPFLSNAGLTTGILIVCVYVLCMLAYPIVICAFTYAISQRYMNVSTSIGDAYKYVFQRLGSVFLTILLIGLVYLGLVVIGVIGCALMFTYKAVGLIIGIPLTIAAIVAVTCFSLRVLPLCYTALIVEGVAKKEAIIRSWRLADRHVGRIVGYTFVAGIIVSIISSMVQYGVLGIAYPIIGRDNTTAMGLFSGVICGIVGVLVAPVSPIVTVLLYYDIRIRKEGFDLQMLAYDLASRTGNAADLPKPSPANVGQVQYQPAIAQEPVCAHCHYPIRSLEDGVMCPSCKSVLHRSCWNQHGGCTTPGCPASPEQNTPAQQ